MGFKFILKSPNSRVYGNLKHFLLEFFCSKPSKCKRNFFFTNFDNLFIYVMSKLMLISVKPYCVNLFFVNLLSSPCV